MKKLCLCLLLLLLCLPCALAETAPFTAVALPDDLSQAFSASEWSDYGAIAYGVSYDETAACVAMRSGNKNVLCVLELKNGQWKFVVKSSAALYQGKRCPLLIFSDAHEFHVYYGVSEYDTVNDDYEEYVLAKGSDGVYRMTEYSCAYATDRAQDFTCYAMDNGLEYQTFSPFRNETETVFVSGVLERALPYFNISLFPKSPDEAQLKLSSPDNLPSGSELKVQNVSLTKGKKYPVYSAPYADSVRAAGGKAAVSTNDWISVFGQDGQWLLIEYDISSNQSRFGYITAAALPKNTNVQELLFAYRDARITKTCTITDDPLRSKIPLKTVYADEYVTYLADFGDGWAYVEYQSGSECLRGFIQEKLLEIL